MPTISAGTRTRASRRRIAPSPPFPIRRGNTQAILRLVIAAFHPLTPHPGTFGHPGTLPGRPSRLPGPVAGHPHPLEATPPPEARDPDRLGHGVHHDDG